MIAQVARGDGHWLEVFLLLVLLAASAGGVKAVEQDLFPIDFVAALLFLRGLTVLALGLLFFFLFFLDEIEERIVEQLLLQVLLRIEERHVQEIHRLVKAWIDLELLPELCGLGDAGLHGAAPATDRWEKRSRSRAVSVGPR